MYVRMNAWMHACMYECILVWLFVWMHAWIIKSTHTSVSMHSLCALVRVFCARVRVGEMLGSFRVTGEVDSVTAVPDVARAG
jgi:hypothetical protein